MTGDEACMENTRINRSRAYARRIHHFGCRRELGCASERILAFVWCLISIQHFSRAENLEGWVDCYKRQCEDLDECLDVLMDKNNSLSRKCRELEDKTSAETGEWIDSSVTGSALSECSLCHYDCGAWSMKFCPNCGHPMKGGRS